MHLMHFRPMISYTEVIIVIITIIERHDSDQRHASEERLAQAKKQAVATATLALALGARLLRGLNGR